MEYKLKSRDGKSEISLLFIEKQEVESQQTSFSFTCGVQSTSFSASLENIWLDKGDIEEICDGICTYIKSPSNGFNSFPSYSDLIMRIEKADSQGHHSVKYILEDKGLGLKQEGHFDVDLIDLEQLESYFRSLLS
jgi:hypothetical protein